MRTERKASPRDPSDPRPRRRTRLPARSSRVRFLARSCLRCGAIVFLAGCLAGLGCAGRPAGGPGPGANPATGGPGGSTDERETIARWVVRLPGGADASEADELASTLAWELDSPVAVRARGGVWSVLVGEFSSRRDAERLLADLRDRGHRSAALVDLAELDRHIGESGEMGVENPR